MNSLYLITGGSRGLGAALVKLASAQGASVLSLSRGVPPAGEHISCDLTDPDAAVEAAIAALQRQDCRDIREFILINNAATLQPFGTNPAPTQIAQHMAVNLVAPIALAQAFSKALAAANARKLVVNVSSGAATKPLYGWGLYCAAKAGLEHFARTFAVEQAKALHPVDIVNVNPGVMDTGMQTTIRSLTVEEFPDVGRFKQFYENNELATPDQVAAMFLQGISLGTLYSGRTVAVREFASGGTGS